MVVLTYKEKHMKERVITEIINEMPSLNNEQLKN